MIIEIASLIILCVLLYIVFYVKITLLVILSVILIILIIGYNIWRLLQHKTVETFDFRFRDDTENVDERPEIYCGDEATLPPDYDRMGTRGVCLKKGIGLGMSLPDSQRQAFLNKPPKPPKTENLYCGNAEVLPNGYDGFDTLSNCLKRGVGVGLHMPQEKYSPTIWQEFIEILTISTSLMEFCLITSLRGEVKILFLEKSL